MSHYYTNDPTLKSDIKDIAYDFRGVRLTFNTDAGVFSKERVDFGTNVLLNALQEEDIEFKKVLDVGCGYGVIGLCVAKKYPSANVDLVDVNERALELAKLNKESNKITNARIYESNVYLKVVDKYDLIITNPPIRAGKDVVWKIVLGSNDRLFSGGVIYVVIQKKQGAPSLIKEMENIFESVEIVEKKNGYFILRGRKF